MPLMVIPVNESSNSHFKHRTLSIKLNSLLLFDILFFFCCCLNDEIFFIYF